VRREGAASPLANYCSDSGQTCQSNADCDVAAECLTDAAMPALAALSCAPATSLPTVNGGFGMTGPMALRAELLLRICRCGDAKIGCDEQCDEGDAEDGDGCSSRCQDE
jgi:cysteine-rich repeat protein